MTQRASNRFYPSLHGKHAGFRSQGLNRDRKRLYVDGGFASGVEGAERRYGGPQLIELWEDFLGDVVPDQINSRKGSDGGCVDWAVNAQIGGVARGTTGAGAGATMAVNGVQMDSYLNWKASNGGQAFEARVKLSQITTISVFIGFTDQVAALEAPITSAASADTITTNATDAVGFMFDTSMTTTKWWLVGVANDVDATAQNSTIAPVAATFAVFRVEVDSSGAAIFYIDGAQVGSKMTGAVTSTVALTPVVAGFTRAAGSATIDVDYWHATANRF